MPNYSISPVTNPDQWHQMIASRPEANFLQSWQWGQFQAKLGKSVFYLGLFEAENLLGGAVVVKEEAKRGWYLTVAGGPLFAEVAPTLSTADQLLANPDSSTPVVADLVTAEDQLITLTQALTELAEAENCLFIRVRPQVLHTSATEQLFQTAGYKSAPMHLTADLTLQLDLTKSEDELLADMRKNTRYEVRKAEKLGITVQESFDPADIQTFFNHQLYLAEKHGFVPFSLEFLQTQFDEFVADRQVSLFHAYDQDQLLASAFIIQFNGEAVYHYGISTPENAKKPGSYACQWAAIKTAKARGCSRYNFWGIAPKDQPDHRFAGVSLFKRGFGGVEVPYLPAQDLPVNWKYGVTHAFEAVRKKVRHL